MVLSTALEKELLLCLALSQNVLVLVVYSDFPGLQIEG